MTFLVVTRKHDLGSREHDLVIHKHDLLSRAYYLVCRAHDWKIYIHMSLLGLHKIPILTK